MQRKDRCFTPRYHVIKSLKRDRCHVTRHIGLALHICPWGHLADMPGIAAVAMY